MARLRLAEAALARLDELSEGDCAADDENRAQADLEARIGRARARIDGDQAAEPDGLTDRELGRALNAAERAELARLYDDGTISRPTRQRPQRGLDWKPPGWATTSTDTGDTDSSDGWPAPVAEDPLQGQ